MWKGSNYVCKKCHVARTLKWRHQQHPTYEADRHRMRAYGVSREQFDSMIKEQSGQCDICGRTIVDGGKKARAPHIDHCHKSGKVRALLCIHCNTMLGSAMDNPNVLRRAAKYLETHKEENSETK